MRYCFEFCAKVLNFAQPRYDLRYIARMFSIAHKRTFVAGAAFGIAIAEAILAAAWLWPAHRSKKDATIYDYCLIQNQSNTVRCDALMRYLDRHELAVAEKNKQAKKMLASGRSKHDVIEWAQQNGLVGSEISDAAGISLKDLQSNNY